MRGFISRIVDGKLFGFIESDRKDYFFHAQDTNAHWSRLAHRVQTERVEVEFDGKETSKGLRAENVSIVE